MGDDPLTFLSELCKKMKFCRISKVIDGVQCDKCHQKVQVDSNDEQATEKYVLHVYFKGVNHNEFCAYITDELGRAGAEASFKEINKLWLQFTSWSTRTATTPKSGKLKQRKQTENQSSPNTAILATSEATLLVCARMPTERSGTSMAQ